MLFKYYCNFFYNYFIRDMLFEMEHENKTELLGEDHSY